LGSHAPRRFRRKMNRRNFGMADEKALCQLQRCKGTRRRILWTILVAMADSGFTIVSWNKLAELLGQHLQKGRKVYVEGRLIQRSWDGPDGQKRYRTEVVANQVLFLDRPQGAPLADAAGAHATAPTGDIDPDDLPFDC